MFRNDDLFFQRGLCDQTVYLQCRIITDVMADIPGQVTGKPSHYGTRKEKTQCHFSGKREQTENQTHLYSGRKVVLPMFYRK